MRSVYWIIPTAFLCIACSPQSNSTFDFPPVSTGYAVVDTNQTQCFDANGVAVVCTGTGQDADYSGNQPSYSVSANGLVVEDGVTGLVWTQSTDLNGDGIINVDDKKSFSDANAYCQSLSLAGNTDWRIPSIKELYSLILFSGKDASNYEGTDTSALTPFIAPEFDWAFGDLDAGERIIDGQYATSTQYESTTMNNSETMFGVNFVDGRIKGYPINNKNYYVRCVTGNTSYGANDFVDNQDGTVTDRATQLMWQQSDNGPANWDNAISGCEAATTAGYSNWRLPDIKELHTILDYSRSPVTTSSAAINPVFDAMSFTNEAGQMDWHYYWASTTHVSHDDKGFNGTYVSFGRALGYMNSEVMDVHGAGAQRSNHKTDVSSTGGAFYTDPFYHHGPQGDILRHSNQYRCVRGI